MDGLPSNASGYLDPDIDVEIATLGLPAPKWMGLEDLARDTSVVCVAERVLSGDCNDGIDSSRLRVLLQGMMSSERLYAWLQTDDLYRNRILDELAGANVTGFAPFDVRTFVREDGNLHSLRRVTEINPSPSVRQLSNVKAGILAFSLSRDELQEIGLPDSVLTFSGWNDDRMALVPRSDASDRLLTCFPSYSDLVNAYELSVFPAGDHGSDCIIASKCANATELGDSVQAALEKLGWRWACRGLIEGDDYEEFYKRSMAEERHPGHSRIDLNLDQD